MKKQRSEKSSPIKYLNYAYTGAICFVYYLSLRETITITALQKGIIIAGAVLLAFMNVKVNDNKQEEQKE